MAAHPAQGGVSMGATVQIGSPASPLAVRDAGLPRRDEWSVELVDPLTDGRWEAFVGHAPHARVFHHRSWLALLRRVYGFPIVACCVVDRSGAIRGGAPLALVRRAFRRPRLACLPLSDRCAPLPAPGDDAVMAERVLWAVDELRRVIRVPAEVRGEVAEHPAARVACRYCASDIRLEPDVDRVLSRARSDTLAIAKDAEREMVVERRTDAAALAEFHLLQVATRERGDAPAPPRQLILGLAYLFDRGLGFALLARDDLGSAGGAIFLVYNRTLRQLYDATWSSSAGIAARHLLMLEGIRWGCEAGIETLDLGCTEFGETTAREFNRSWGAEERVLEFTSLDESPRVAETGRWPARLLGRRRSAAGRVVDDITRWAS
jgi:hypothetical protein